MSPVYRRLLRLLPRDFVLSHGAEVEQALSERLRSARGGQRLLVHWLAFVDIASSGRRLWARHLARKFRNRGNWGRHRKPGQQMQNLFSDVRFALRTFSRQRGQTTLAAVTLALGIGASSAMFSIIDSVLLRPLPYPDPEELVSVYPAWPAMRGHPTMGEMAERGTWAWPEVFAVQDQQTVFESFAAYEAVSLTVSGDGRPERMLMGRATWQLFPMLGVNPILGRTFTSEDDPRTGDRVVVLSAGLWRERFGGDAAAIGQSLVLSGTPYTVVGVLPDWFRLGTLDARAWIPRTGSTTEGGWGNHAGTLAIARLKPGVTAEVARQEITSILRSATPEWHRNDHEASVFPRHADETHTARPALLVLIAASFVLLAVACGNVAALLLGSGIERQQELSVRGALGASRGRIIQQLLTESVVLALVGAVGGILVAIAATKSLVFLAPPGIPRMDQVGVDTRVLGFTIGVASLAGVVFGLIPALSLSPRNLAQSIISSRGTTGGRPRIQSAVVVSEMALATVLLVGAALLVRTLSSLNRTDPGFQPDGLIAVQMALPYQRFNSAPDSTRDAVIDSYFQSIVDEVGSLPGVTGVAVTNNVPLTADRGNNEIAPAEGSSDADPMIAEFRFVSANLFDVLRIPIIEGRGFDATDDAAGAPPAVILSQPLANRFWPDGSAVGRTVTYWGRNHTVIGVAGVTRDESLDSSTEFAYYTPLRQWGAQVGSLIIRTSGDPRAAIPSIRERIWSVDSEIPVTLAAPMRDLMSGSLAEQSYRARLMTVFAALAGLFAILGIYGVTARSVARRSREMAIRMALGAEHGTVMGMILRQGVVLAAIGAGAGFALSLVTGRFIENLLVNVSPLDPLALGSIAVIVGLGSLMASLPPSRRATKVDPMTVLRAE